MKINYQETEVAVNMKFNIYYRESTSQEFYVLCTVDSETKAKSLVYELVEDGYDDSFYEATT